MFSPPPSPLPPRHPPVESSSDGDDDADDNSPTLTAEEIPQITGEVQANRPIIPAQSSSGLTSFSRIRRHLLVFMVPLILLIVCSTSSFIAAHEERGADNNLPVWRETFGGSLRDPSFPPMIAMPAHHMLSSLSRHLHRARLYGVGRGLSPSFPAPPTNEPRGYGDNENKNGGVPVAQTTVPPTPTVVNAARDARESAPSIPAQAWPVPTPCKLSFLSFGLLSWSHPPIHHTPNLGHSDSLSLLFRYNSSSAFRLVIVVQFHHLFVFSLLHQPARQ